MLRVLSVEHTKHLPHDMLRVLSIEHTEHLPYDIISRALRRLPGFSARLSQYKPKGNCYIYRRLGYFARNYRNKNKIN